MSRYIYILIFALIAPALVACDGSTLSTNRGASESQRARLTEADANKKSAKERAEQEANFEHIDFADAPDDKVEPALELSEDEWRERLSDEEYHVLREAGTEHAFSGELLKNKQEGVYVCGGCGEPLFSSETKFKSGTGWPSFYDAVEDGTVGLAKDRSHGMERIEVYCTHCGGHLGHVFNDGPAPTGLRYCVNSDALEFEPADSEEVDSEEVASEE